MKEQYSRTAFLLSEEGVERLRRSRVAVFGIGGVGGFCAEALARAGVGTLHLIDHDTVSESNINRQIIALHSTLGRSKVSVMAERIRDIDPDCTVVAHDLFYGPDTEAALCFSDFDYVVDAIDTVTGKLLLILKAEESGVPIICAMGAGNKLDPTRFEVADIYATSVCPLAKVMRRECRKRGIEALKVVYSREEPVLPDCPEYTEKGKAVPGSLSFVPSVMGLLLAGEVIKALAGI